MVSKQLLDPTGRWCQGRNTSQLWPYEGPVVSAPETATADAWERDWQPTQERNSAGVAIIARERGRWRLCRPAVDIQGEAKGEAGHSIQRRDQSDLASHLQNMGLGKKPRPSPVRRVFRSDYAVLVADLQGKKELIKPWHLDESHKWYLYILCSCLDIPEDFAKHLFCNFLGHFGI